MPVVSVSMPDTLLERLDTHVEAHDYAGRSEMIRESTRSLLTEFETDRFEDTLLAGTVKVCYDFGTPQIERRVAALRHEFDDSIAANDHSHVGDYCLDLFVLEDNLDVIASFVAKLRAVDGVEHMGYSLVALEASTR